MRRLVIIVPLVLLVPGLALAQSPIKKPAAAKTGVAEQLIALERAWNDAVLEYDVAWHERHLAGSFAEIGLSGDTGTKSTTIAAVKARTFKADSMKLTDMKVQAFGNFAVVTALSETVNGSNSGKPYPPKVRLTDVWVRRNGQWQCVAEHLSAVK